jgi:hypothetical protein
MTCDRNNSIPPAIYFYRESITSDTISKLLMDNIASQEWRDRDDALIAINFTSSTAYSWAGLANNTEDIQDSILVIVLDQGSRLRAHIGSKVGQAYVQPLSLRLASLK